MQVSWTSPALADLEEIQNFIAQDSPIAAYRLANNIFETANKLLSDNPMIGRVGRAPGTRELIISGTQYVVAYRVQDRIDILAVMHGAREWPERF